MRFERFHAVAGVAVATLGIAFAASCGGHKSPSKIEDLKIDRTVTLPDLDGPVDFVRDEFGRAHIYGTTIHDVAEVTGWAHTEDRFIQMDLQRRAATHRLSELIGPLLPSAVDLDKSFHAYSLDYAAKEIYAALPPTSELKISLDAYTVGVNAKLADFGSNPPFLEYGIFGYPFDQTPAWTAIDSLAVGRLLAFQLDWDGDAEIGFADEVSRAALFTTGAHAGFAADTILRFKPSELVSIVAPDLTLTPMPAFSGVAPWTPSRPLPVRSLRGARSRYDALASVPFFKRFLRNPQNGSNDWVVGPSKTKSHHPIVSNDPHLGLEAPPVWYELHQSTAKYGGDVDVVGVSFPGVPSVVLGGNGYVGWGVTDTTPDATDVYIEHYSLGTGSNGADQVLWDDDAAGPHTPAYVDLVKDTADLVVRGAGGTTIVNDVIWRVPHRNGVIVPGSLVLDTSISLVTGTALSWAWTGFNNTREFESFALLSHAKSAADVVAAVALFGAAPENFVYADSSGSFGYSAGGWYPVRDDDDGDLHTDPPYLPMPGYDGRHEWIGRLDATQIPHEEGPARGWIASSNQDPLGTNFDNDPLNDAVYLGAIGFDIGFRGARSSRELDTLTAITPQDMMVLQADHHSNWGARMVPILIPLIANAHPNEAALLQGWQDRGFLAASGVGNNVGANEIDDAAATSLFNTWMVATRIRLFGDEEELAGFGLDQFQAAKTMLFILEHPTEAATFDASTGESALWDDIRTPAVESKLDILNAALADALAFLASPQGFGSADPNEWRWGLLHTLTMSRQSTIPAGDIPTQTDPSLYPNGYPRHSDLFALDVGNFGLGDYVFTYAHGASMRMVIDLTPGRMRMYNALPGGNSADIQSPHYSDRAEEYAKNLTRETWYREKDVASHGKQRLHFSP